MHPRAIDYVRGLRRNGGGGPGGEAKGDGQCSDPDIETFRIHGCVFGNGVER
jgi:hypothetical protein